MNTAFAPTLTAVDRCDRCGAQAYLHVKLTSGGELLFCAHHGHEHVPRMKRDNLISDIVDESRRLQETPTSASAGER